MDHCPESPRKIPTPPADSQLTLGRYLLRPLLRVRQDDIREFLGPGPGVYICNLQEPAWYRQFGFQQTFNYSTEKKRTMFSRMGAGSRWISPTFDAETRGPTRDWAHGPVLHVGYGRLQGRAAQTRQALRMAAWLWAHRREYDYCLVYNFYLPNYLAPLGARLFLGKGLYVDYEDDYTLQRSSRLKNLAEALLRRTVTGAICINQRMAPYFRGRRVCVSNCFADLSYAAGADFSLRDNMRLLFSGRLDEIRGVDLIPQLVQALRQRVSGFKIQITGDGPLRELVQSWRHPEVEYLGFLDSDHYQQVLRGADACLILQRPDHPSSRGLFPSKVEAYARHHKPVFVLDAA